MGFVAEHPSAGVIGGAERAMATLTAALAARDVEIHYFSCAIPPSNQHDMKFHKINYSFNFRKNLIPATFINLIGKTFERARQSSYAKILSKHKCDVYVQVCAGQPTGIVADYCRQTKIPFIFRSTSLWDSDLTFHGWSGLRPSTRQLYLYGLENADKIVPNSRQTAMEFKKIQKYNDKVRFIPDGFNIPENPINDFEEYVLWVGRNAAYKRPEIYVELAEKLPQIKFVMVGYIPNNQNLPPNLYCVGRIDDAAELAELYRDAYFIVNTSLVEGFPNVLVEAAMHYKPYVGFFDPDNVVKNFDLGFQAIDFDDLVCKVKLLMEDETLRATKGLNARGYVEENHDINKTVVEWVNLFEEFS